MLEMMLEIICKVIGCRPMFYWTMQLVRHAKKCTKLASETVNRKYILKDGVYVCFICNKSFAYQSIIIRHTKVRNNNTIKE